MDKLTEIVYFENSQNKRVVLTSPQNKNYWEIKGRKGFSAPDVDLYSETMASGKTIYFGKYIKPRHCSLQMVCKGRTTAERDRLFYDLLETLIDKDSNDEGKLYLRKSDGAQVYLNCVYEGGMNIEKEYKIFSFFNIEFFAADPLFYLVSNPNITFLGV